jgi:hypothetical protein
MFLRQARLGRGLLKGMLAATVLLTWSAWALAQQGGGGGGGYGGGGGGGGMGGSGSTTIGGGGGNSGLGGGGSSSSSNFGGGSLSNAFNGSFGSGSSTGSIGGSTSSLGSTNSGIVSASNPLAATYGNPLSGGAVGSNGQITFGKAIYNSTGTTGTTLNRNGIGGSARVGTNNPLNGSNNYMAVRSPGAYVTQFVDFPRAGDLSRPAAQMQGEVNQVLGSSSVVPAGSGIRVMQDGETMVLQGMVRGRTADDGDRQRLLIESMLRLRSGVRNVKNELQVEPRPTQPTP